MSIHQFPRDPFHAAATLSSTGDAQHPISLIEREWIPLDALAQEWADVGSNATSAQAFQAIGMAFTALAFEASARKHYTLSWHGAWQHTPALLVRGLRICVNDLSEASRYWHSVVLWLEKLANEEVQEQEELERIRHLFALLQAQIHRLSHLWMAVHQELATLTGSCVPMPLGTLSSEDTSGEGRS